MNLVCWTTGYMTQKRVCQFVLHLCMDQPCTWTTAAVLRSFLSVAGHWYLIHM